MAARYSICSILNFPVRFLSLWSETDWMERTFLVLFMGKEQFCVLLQHLYVFICWKRGTSSRCQISFRTARPYQNWTDFGNISLLISLFISGRYCLKNTVSVSFMGECLKQLIAVCVQTIQNTFNPDKLLYL